MMKEKKITQTNSALVETGYTCAQKGEGSSRHHQTIMCRSMPTKWIEDCLQELQVHDEIQRKDQG